jgi:predicted N-acetyltransferase YhbS
MIAGRLLQRAEIAKAWTIDRSEVIEAIYTVAGGDLSLHQEYFNMHGWPPGESEIYTSLLVECFDRGGWFYGLFDDGVLIAVAILDNQWIGERGDLLQLKFLHVSCAYRDQGIGRRLFDLAANEARRRGAKGIYVSATPSEHTIKFYVARGCKVTTNPDPELYALEPEDIHLVCEI